MHTFGRIFVFVVFVAGCGSEGHSRPEGPVALFKLYPESTAEFYDLPFPSDLRRDADGTISLAHFPDPQPALLVGDYIDAAEELSDFGTTSVTYFRFSESVDQSTLPASAAETLGETATVFLVDVDEASPTPGARHPAVVVYQDEPTKYWAPHTVAVRPAIGRPLAWGRRYAAVVTRGVAPAASERFARDADFEAIFGGGGRAEVRAARALYEDPLEIVEASGVPRDEILSMTVFTTQSDFTLLEQARDHLVMDLPEPEMVGDPSLEDSTSDYALVTGRYTSPTFQHGTLPYSSISDGGAFELDGEGNPVVAEHFSQRFALSIPKNHPMPPSGFPIVLYAHGTGGSAYSPMNNGVAARLAARGVAVMGIDQLHHAPRVDLDVGATQVAVYNVLNPQAFRYNALQAALDVVQQARAVPLLELSTESVGLDPELLESELVFFDPGEIHFMGHSQGGQNGPLFLAVDEAARSAVLSGAGGQFTLALLEKIEPLDIPGLVAGALFLPGGSTEAKLALENVSPEHPILNLLQTWMDVADPVNYAHRFFVDPRPSFAPKHVFMTEGIDDTYTPPPSIEALAVAAQIPLLAPVLEPIAELTRVGEEPACPPVWENAPGGVTAGLSQYAGADLPFPRDGHFVTFQEPAMTQVEEFFGTAIRDPENDPEGVPEIVAGHVDPRCEGL